MSELRRYSVSLADEDVERIRLMAHDLSISESKVVRLAVEFYEQCLDGLAKAVVEGSGTVAFDRSLGRKCRDDIEEVGVVGEVEGEA